MGKLQLGVVIVLALGCAPKLTIRSHFVPEPPRAPVSLPRPRAIPDPHAITVAPFVLRTLAPGAEPPYSLGAVTARRTLNIGPGVSIRAEWETPRRIVVEDARHRFWLIDPIADHTIAEIAEPDYFYRLSPTELVVRHSNGATTREAVVDVATGAELAPSPILPIADPIERLYVLHDEHERSDVFLLAKAGGRTFVGPWNDRARAPRLAYEIPSSQGWTPYRRDDGLELSIYPPDPTCRARWLHRVGAPTCLDRSRFDDRHTFEVSGMWELQVEPVDDEHAQLVARAHGVEQRIDVPCKEPSFVDVATRRPQALVTCYPPRDAADPRFSITAWTPGRAYVMRVSEQKRQGMTGSPNNEGRLLPLSSLHDLDAITEQWLDLQTGAVLAGPPLLDLRANDGAQVLAASGEETARMAIIIDADAHTLRTVGALPCPGELQAHSPVPDLTIVTCGIRDQPGVYNFTWRWTKAFDLQRGRIYDLPGYPEVVFADRTVILSNRTHYAAETWIRSGRLTIATLD